MNRSRRMLTVAGVAVLAVWLVGCASPLEPESESAVANRSACGGDECHDAEVDTQRDGAHSDLACAVCHASADERHAADPEKVAAESDWTIDACAKCHETEAVTYLYDDNAKVGPFGGSQRSPSQPKSDTFPEYASIAAGHAFTKEYNEEGAHAYMLEDHYEITRGKFETCVQCKSTKVALAWDSGKPLTVAKDTEIELTHTKAPGIEAKKVTIPKGTKITYASDQDSREVDAKAVFPDGTTWTSQPAKSEDATQNFNMLWASTIAATKDTWPYGIGCNHCHDPHSGGERLVRRAMLDSISGAGGIDGAGGVNPYQADSPKDWTKASAKDRQILACAQCHVEYTCGKSGVDGVDRDAYGWSKATDLHDLYSRQFGYAQDWKNALMGEPLIKSQHPETEFYWNSVHYDAGASCSDCHMPEVRDKDNRTVRSHWFTSPYKYRDPRTWSAFAAKTGLSASPVGNPCTRCHQDRTARAIAQQRAFYQRQGEVETLLTRSVRQFAELKAAKDEKKPVKRADYDAALEAHRRAHVIWENLAVSENSMGFHNFEEAMGSMDEAEKQVRIALQKEEDALK